MTTTRLAQMEIDENVDFTRQRGFFDPTKSDKMVTVVGCGGIGSPTAVLLSKLGIPNLTLIDPDDLELHNIPNQFFPRSMVGKPKVDVLASMCRLFGYSDVVTHKCMIQEYEDKFSGIVLTGLDNMDARQAVWQKVKESTVGVEYLIDARIGGQEIVIWTVNPKIQAEVEEYENLGLFSEGEGEETACTERAIIDVMGFVASTLTLQVRLISTGVKPERLLSMSLPSMTVTKWYSENQKSAEASPLAEMLAPVLELREDTPTRVVS